MDRRARRHRGHRAPARTPATREARRFFGTETDIDGHALQWVSRIHGAIVWITVAIALSLLWKLRQLRHDRKVLDAPLTAWILAAGVQGAVGYIQYAAGLPAGLVVVHVAGATTLWPSRPGCGAARRG